MKKNIFLSLCALVICACLCSCNNEEKNARAFVSSLATAMQNKQAGEIAKLYPGSDRLPAFNAQLLLDEEAPLTKADDGTWTLQLADGARLVFTQAEDGTLSVKESFGLAKFDTDRVAFAKKTGWVSEGMSDAAVAERLADEGFITWISGNFISEAKKKASCKLTGTYGDEYWGGEWMSAKGIKVTITNKNDFDFPGSAYKVVCKDWYWGDPSQQGTSKTANGVDVPAGKSATIQVALSTTMESDSSQKLSFNDEALLPLVFAHYTPNGNEYKEYLESKKN